MKATSASARSTEPGTALRVTPACRRLKNRAQTAPSLRNINQNTFKIAFPELLTVPKLVSWIQNMDEETIPVVVSLGSLVSRVGHCEADLPQLLPSVIGITSHLNSIC